LKAGAAVEAVAEAVEAIEEAMVGMKFYKPLENFDAHTLTFPY